ncbi:hypothetical protein D9M68_846610 [compost metagenome]
MTGAEKPRSKDGSGRSATSTKVTSCSASLIESTRDVPPALASPARRNGISPPCPSSRPSSTGMTKGSFSRCPGVAGQLWRKLRL